MPSRTAQRRTSQRTPTKTSANGEHPELADTGAPAPPEEQQAPGVAILRQPTPDGGQDIQIITLGNMDPLAVPMLLELAIKIHKEKFGLTERK